MHKWLLLLTLSLIGCNTAAKQRRECVSQIFEREQNNPGYFVKDFKNKYPQLQITYEGLTVYVDNLIENCIKERDNGQPTTKKILQGR